MTKNKQKSVTIIGGGWAGLAAATELIDHGFAVKLFERAPNLGGRASSFWDDDFGEWLDNGTHLFLGAYVTSLNLLKKWGSVGGIDFNLSSEIVWMYPRGKTLKLKLGGGKLGAAKALMSFKGMSFGDKIRCGKAIEALVKIASVSPSSPTIADLTVAQFLSRYGIKKGSCGGLWDMLTVAVMNAPIELAALQPLSVALGKGLLSGSNAGRLGLMNVPFQDLYIQPATQYLTERGAEIVTGTGVKTIDFDSADAVLLAVSPHDVIKLLPGQVLKDADLAELKEFSGLPIVSVHINFADPVLQMPFALMPDSFAQWVFRRGDRGGGGWKNLTSVISAAPGKSDMSNSEIEKRVISEIRDCLNTSSKIEAVRTVRTARATVTLTPEVNRLRPSVRTAVENLYIAGDWCNTGLPATIESAAVSGVAAARAIIEDYG